MEGCGLNCIKYLLFIFNFFFTLAGVGLIVAGSLVLTEANYDLLDGQSKGPAIALIVVGVFIFVTAFLGCCGAIKENYCMLVTFAVILVVIFLVQLSVGITAAVYKDSFKEEFNKELNASLNNYQSSSFTREAWAVVQSDFECCGIYGPDDWKSTPGQVPASCCGDVDTSTSKSSDQTCAVSQVKYTDGCLDKLTKLIRDGLLATLIVAIVIAFIELLGAILACCVAKNIQKREEEVA